MESVRVLTGATEPNPIIETESLEDIDARLTAGHRIGDDREGIGRGDGADPGVAADCEQVPVARDDEIGFSCDRSRDDVIVVGIGVDHRQHRERRHCIGRACVIGDERAGADADQSQPLGGEGSCQHSGEFVKQCRAGE